MAFVAPIVESCGGRRAFAEQAGIPESAVRCWLSRGAVPYVRSVVSLAATFSWDLDQALVAAGKPPLAELRRRVGSDAATSLPMRLCAWRDENGFDTNEAAAELGVARFEFSKLANGSIQPSSPARVHKIASALGIEPVEVLEAAGITTGRLYERVAAANTGFAGWLRRRLDLLGVDTWDKAEVAETAAYCGVGGLALADWLAGSRVPDLISAQKLAALTGDTLTAVLTAAGVEDALARRYAAALAGARRRRRDYCSTGELIRSCRIARDISSKELAHRLGMADHTSVVRWESGEHTPSPERLVGISNALGVPLARLFHAAKLAV